MAVFRLYDLENRAEALIGRGATVSEVVEFDTFLEEKKQELYKSEKTEEWTKIVFQVRKKWQDFIKNLTRNN